MSDFWSQIIGVFREGFSKVVFEARTPAGVRRRAGRYERRAVRSKSKKRIARLNKIAEQLWEQARRMESEAEE